MHIISFEVSPRVKQRGHLTAMLPPMSLLTSAIAAPNLSALEIIEINFKNDKT